MGKQTNSDTLLPDFASSKNRRRIESLSSQHSSRPRHKRWAIIVPPADPGSLGDEAMIQALTTKLRRKLYTVDLLVSDVNQDWSHIDGIRRKVSEKDYLEALPDYANFYLIGADVLDGYYSAKTPQKLLWYTFVAAHLSGRATIIGSSFNRTPTKEVIASFSILPTSVRVCMRDKFSLNNFKEKTGRDATLVSDVAFLLKPAISDHTSPYTRWTHEQKLIGQKVVGVNMSQHSFLDIGFGDPKYNARYMAAELRRVLDSRPEISLIFLPHDIRPNFGDAEILSGVFSQLSEKYPNRVKLVDTKLVGAAGIKAIARTVNVIVSGRMHLAIASLGTGVPVASMVYQGKFEGLYAHFNIEGLTVSPRDVLDNKGKFAEIITILLTQEQELREKIAQHLPAVLKLSKNNL